MTEDELLAAIRELIVQDGDVDRMARRIMVLCLRELGGRDRGAAMDRMHRGEGGAFDGS